MSPHDRAWKPLLLVLFTWLGALGCSRPVPAATEAVESKPAAAQAAAGLDLVEIRRRVVSAVHGGYAEDQAGQVQQDLASLVLGGPAFAEVGIPYQAQVLLVGPAPEVAPVFRLVGAPEGMSIDAGTGGITWTPSANQAGQVRFGLRASARGALLRSRTTIAVQGRELLASQTISAAGGGLLAVSAPQSAFDGSQLSFPPGALASDETVEFFEVTESVLNHRVAPVLALEPSQSFTTPVQVEIAYTDDFLAQLGVADESRLSLYHFDEATWEWQLVPSSVDVANNRVLASVTHFSLFSLFVDGLDALVGEVEQAMRFFVDTFHGVKSTAQEYAHSFQKLVGYFSQPRSIVFVQGSSFDREETNALLVHGLFSGQAEFSNLISFASQKYDNVAFYNYPSRASIQANADWLGALLRTRKDLFDAGASFDIYAHSMGGLVSRALIEQRSLDLVLAGNHVANLVTLGTPHHGGDKDGLIDGFEGFIGTTVSGALLTLADFIFQPTPGLLDLVPGSAFLRRLNPAAFQGWTAYYVLAGGGATGTNDGWVNKGSALAVGSVVASGADFWPTLKHSELHTGLDPAGPYGLGLFTIVKPTAMNEQNIVELVEQLNAVGPDFDGCYTNVNGVSTYDFGSQAVDYGLPPFTIITSGWKVECPIGEDEFYGHFYLTADGNPHVTVSPLLEFFGHVLNAPLWDAAVGFPFDEGAMDCPCSGFAPVPQLVKVVQIVLPFPEEANPLIEYDL